MGASVKSVSDREVGGDDGHPVTGVAAGWHLNSARPSDHLKACSHPPSPPSQYRVVSESVVWPQCGRYALEIKKNNSLLTHTSPCLGLTQSCTVLVL